MQELIPISLFICIAYSIHALADARARGKLVAPHVPEEVIRSLALLEEERRRQGALRWGISLLSLALAMGLLEAMGARDLSFGAAAALTGSFGLGQLLAWRLARPAGAR
ncbi:hypothetical protein [Stenotrophomonas sp. 24(2023)]|uniref:hypothetical protein n=1 Tax=Stenotrophomonas sp. 24(2023) TaxID=3068324 RepID=UPI0027E14BA2|nr:hypothetical protein [Stenotrophomonas sp. 24(2023)]WMJ70975.1 hypothetical protein Q9R17_07715 [Stenotrophomonas sp. 24(2023)]